MCWHGVSQLLLSLGTWEPHRDSEVAQRRLLQQDGDSWRQSPDQDAPATPIRLSVAVCRGEVLWGWSFKVQPCCQWGSKGHGGPGTALHHVPEPCQQPAGPQQLPRICASSRGTCSVLPVELCRRAGGHGEVLA